MPEGALAGLAVERLMAASKTSFGSVLALSPLACSKSRTAASVRGP
jgi:hypothetical protein